MIERAMPFLKALEGARLRGGPDQNHFNALFDLEEVTAQNEIDLAHPDDPKLQALSELLDND